MISLLVGLLLALVVFWLVAHISTVLAVLAALIVLVLALAPARYRRL